MSLLHPPPPSANPQTHYWSVGTTLCIGRIINSKGEEVDSLVLEPQGIAHLISREPITLQHDTCGFAHVLTRMCNRGLLTLNIGVIDPGWNNLISTSVLNFSSERRLLEKGTPFIRVTFHPVAGGPGPLSSKNVSEAEYTAQVRDRAVGDFGKHFLNIRQLVAKATKKENDRLRDAMLKYLPIAAFSLAFFALLVTVGTTLASRVSDRSTNAANAEIDRLSRVLQEQDRRIAEIQASMAQSQKLRTTPETISPVPEPKFKATLGK